MNDSKEARLYASLPMPSKTGNAALIHIQALIHNYRQLTSLLSSDTKPICVVKADAYGHSASLIAPALWGEGCRRFAVSCIEEAMDLRQILPGAEILIVGYASPSDVGLLAAEGLTATALSPMHLAAMASEARDQGVRVKLHIKADTGMNRIGFAAYSEADCVKSAEAIQKTLLLGGAEITGVFSHFLGADEPDKEHETHRQAARFTAFVSALERHNVPTGIKHICNSAGAIRYPQYHMNAVRLGLALYGYPPCECTLSLEPVMSLESCVTHIHHAPSGEAVGYGGGYRCLGERTLATLKIGYADGFIRAYSGCEVFFKTSDGNFSARVVGRICMDQCMVDVTGLPIAVGDRAVLFGERGEQLRSLADRAGSIVYEALCLVSSRVPRLLGGGEEDAGLL